MTALTLALGLVLVLVNGAFVAVEFGILGMLRAAASDDMDKLTAAVVSLKALLALQAVQRPSFSVAFLKGLPWLITAPGSDMRVSAEDQRQAWDVLRKKDDDNATGGLGFFLDSDIFDALKQRCKDTCT